MFDGLEMYDRAGLDTDRAISQANTIGCFIDAVDGKFSRLCDHMFWNPHTGSVTSFATDLTVFRSPNEILRCEGSEPDG